MHGFGSQDQSRLHLVSRCQNHQTQPSDYFQSKIQNEPGVTIVIEATVLMQVALANSMFQQHCWWTLSRWVWYLVPKNGHSTGHAQSFHFLCLWDKPYQVEHLWDIGKFIVVHCIVYSKLFTSYRFTVQCIVYSKLLLYFRNHLRWDGWVLALVGVAAEQHSMNIIIWEDWTSEYLDNWCSDKWLRIVHTTSNPGRSTFFKD